MHSPAAIRAYLAACLGLLRLRRAARLGALHWSAPAVAEAFARECVDEKSAHRPVARAGGRWLGWFGWPWASSCHFKELRRPASKAFVSGTAGMTAGRRDGARIRRRYREAAAARRHAWPPHG